MKHFFTDELTSVVNGAKNGVSSTKITNLMLIIKGKCLLTVTNPTVILAYDIN